MNNKNKYKLLMLKNIKISNIIKNDVSMTRLYLVKYNKIFRVARLF